MREFTLATPRLVLRDWQEADLAPFHIMCRDPRVMRFVGPDLTRRQAAGEIARYRREQERDGHSFRALEHRQTGGFIGYCGVRLGCPGTPLAGQPELGWRLATHLWGQGYAHEAAVAAIDWAFGNLGKDRVMAMTSPRNARSWRLMLRLGMRHRPELDFGHSRRTGAARHRPHVVFSMDRSAWQAA
ncbi:GNAT family N-acetyltransferase [Croceibacterium sp. TMG7-5b_MA50]|uniref:GNAT family N-acetyltransferase n=1 Tax=Croceibacterium sp. TMG7-5b_MA50 TaxID=3121290 RepID=UPI0032218CCA